LIESDDSSTDKSNSVNTPARIPKIMHLTWKDRSLGPWRHYLQSWQQKNPDFEFRVYDDNDMLNVVQTHFPHVMPVFSQIPIITKADLFRYMLLLKFGGLYADVDVECERPVSTWAGWDTSSLLVGIEFDARALADYRKREFARQLQFCQWTMAAAPNHPVLQCVVDRVVKNLLDLQAQNLPPSSWNKMDVLDSSGPGPWSDCVSEHIVQQINDKDWDKNEGFQDPKTYGDVTVLPYISFGFHQLHNIPAKHEYRYARHWFGGSWQAKFNGPKRD